MRRQPRKTRKAKTKKRTSGKGVNKTESEESDVDRSGLYQGISCGTLCDRSCKFLLFLSERTKVLNQKAALTDAKTQLNTLQVENEDLNLEIEQSIRFDTVETAAKKYGMVKPDSKHTLRYESQDAEYIRQYGKIPKAD